MKSIVLICLSFLLIACINPEVKQKHNKSVLVVMAHPDDETWVSGTLAKLIDVGLTIVPIYITSGDRGTDRSGKGLSASFLAQEREIEALNAAKILGLSSPIFLRFPDGKVKSHVTAVSSKLELLKSQYNPLMTLTFDPLGITGNKDHQVASNITSKVFDNKVIYFSISETRANKFTEYAKNNGIDFKIKYPISDDAVIRKVDTADFSKHRVETMKQHKTQFVPQFIAVFSKFIEKQTQEEFVITDNETVKLFDKYISK